MKEVRKEIHKGKEILIVEYAESNPDRMIEIFDTAKQLVLADKRKVLVLSIFRGNIATPAFVRHLENQVPEIETLLDKNVVIGLTQVQKWILKGMNVWYKPQVLHFDSFDEAVKFLTD